MIAIIMVFLSAFAGVLSAVTLHFIFLYITRRHTTTAFNILAFSLLGSCVSIWFLCWLRKEQIRNRD
jgi:hypothetical protein